MTRIARWPTIAFGLAVLAGCATPASQMVKNSTDAVSVNPDFQVDNELGEAGRELFVTKSCKGCHTVGLGRSSGPDLFGVVERRPVDWLKNFLKNTDEMLDTDPIAQALLAQHNNTRMPDLQLTDHEVDALIHYMQLKTNERRTMASAGP
jgi:mono/diheme cytochrome c family protein